MKTICKGCGKEFEATHGRKYCCDECRERARKESEKASHRRAHKKKMESRPAVEKVCACCGKKFKTVYYARPYCDECRSTHNRSTLDYYRSIGGRPEKITKVCIVCGKKFETRDPKHVTCGNPECVKEAKRINERKWHRQKHVDEYGSLEAWEEEKERRKGQRHEEALERQEQRKAEALKIRPVFHKICKVCGKPFDTHRPSAKCCSKKCSQRNGSKGKDKRIPKEQIVDKDITLALLYERDHGTCYICGCQCDWEDKTINEDGYIITGNKYPSIEHIVPVSKGGLHSWENVRLACRECNIKKSNEVSADIESLLPNPKIASKYKREVKSRSKEVHQYTEDGTLVGKYKSTAEAARCTGFKAKSIQAVARGECRSCKGFIWRYAV